jgi:hypothetical protein
MTKAIFEIGSKENLLIQLSAYFLIFAVMRAQRKRDYTILYLSLFLFFLFAVAAGWILLNA